MTKKKTADEDAIGGESPTNGGADAIESGIPYVATVRIVGTADMLFHRWNCEAVEEKGRAAKGSKEKKTDNVESYVYRDETGMLCLPGEYVRQSIIAAAKFKQDPRSPRKSAADLFKAAITSLTALAPLGKTKWDYLDKRRVKVQMAAVTRVRPAILKGWEAEVRLMVLLPEYVGFDTLAEVLTNAGRLVGVGDFRPTYGRYRVSSFKIGFDD